MQRQRVITLFALLLATMPVRVAAQPVYRGTCDASAAAAIGDQLFVVANDEDSMLRVYRRDASGEPVGAFDLTSFLDLAKRQEADIEGAARIGNRVYWITSHGANNSGKAQPERWRLFATDITVADRNVVITPAGTPYKDLVRALAEAPALRRFKLDAAAHIAPEQRGGLNIEGLSATPQGTLLIGFRNPVPDGKALLVPLLNPRDVIDRQPARFGKPILLALGGRGVRSIAYVAASASYLIIAGPSSDGGTFHLYEWSGSSDDAPVPVERPELSGLQAEALVVYEEPRAGVQVLSDDGSRRVNGTACKEAPSSEKSFRAIDLAR
jgi:Protein of unknown function (DUF3616)